MNGHSEALAGVFAYLYPEMILAATACVLFLGGTVKACRHLWASVALAGLVVALLALVLTPTPLQSREVIFGNPVIFDALGNLVRTIAIAGGIVLILFAWNELSDRQAADHHACLLVIIAGVGMTALANDLVTLFLALELISIPTYILLYLPRHDQTSQEAALKYFLLSIFSSGLLLFGFSYLYGLAGTTNIPALLHTLNQTGPRDMPVIAQVALIMVVAGLSFRITAVPFHFYAPDVYQGAAHDRCRHPRLRAQSGGFRGAHQGVGFRAPPVLPRTATSSAWG